MIWQMTWIVWLVFLSGFSTLGVQCGNLVFVPGTGICSRHCHFAEYGYDANAQLSIAYDGVSSPVSNYDFFAMLTLVGGENGAVGTSNLFARLAEFLAAERTAATASEDVVSLFHQGNLRGGQVSSTRALSTSPSSDLLHYNPQGQLYEFQVPRSTLLEWERQELIRRFNDLHAPSGIITPEIRVLTPASGQMNQFLVRPPGG